MTTMHQDIINRLDRIEQKTSAIKSKLDSVADGVAKLGGSGTLTPNGLVVGPTDPYNPPTPTPSSGGNLTWPHSGNVLVGAGADQWVWYTFTPTKDWTAELHAVHTTQSADAQVTLLVKTGDETVASASGNAQTSVDAQPFPVLAGKVYKVGLWFSKASQMWLTLN